MKDLIEVNILESNNRKIKLAADSGLILEEILESLDKDKKDKKSIKKQLLV